MRRLSYFLLPAVALGGLVVWRLIQNHNQQVQQANAAKARKSAPPAVRVATAIRRDIVHAYQGVGNIESPADVRIAPKVTGELQYLEVREGDRVTKAQVLARLDPAQVRSAVNQQQAVVQSALANQANAEVRYYRQARLLDKGFVSKQSTDDARTEVDVQKSAVNAARAQLRNIQEQYSDTVLRSPVNGYVTARFYDPGSIVTAGQPIVTVQAVRRVYVTTAVPDDVDNQIRKGMPARVDVDAIPGRPFNGVVSQVNLAADPQSRQFLVRATLNNSRNLLRPGMFCRISFVTRRTANAVVVPREAIQQSKEGPTVVVIDSRSVAHRRRVTAGDQDTVGIQIVEGVNPGDQVVILSAQPLRDSQFVRVEAAVQMQAAQPIVEIGGGAMSGSVQQGGGAAAPTYGGIRGSVGPSVGGSGIGIAPFVGGTSGSAGNTASPGSAGAAGVPGASSQPGSNVPASALQGPGALPGAVTAPGSNSGGTGFGGRATSGGSTAGAGTSGSRSPSTGTQGGAPR